MTKNPRSNTKLAEAVLFFAILYGGQSLLRYLWPWLMELYKDGDFKNDFPGLITGIHFYLEMALYSCFYWFQFPFIEQFKVNPNPWGWKTDRQGWTRLMIKLVFCIIGTRFILNPIAFGWINSIDGMLYDVESFPSL